MRDDAIMRPVPGLTGLALASSLAACGDDGRAASETGVSATSPTAVTGITSVSRNAHLP